MAKGNAGNLTWKAEGPSGDLTLTISGSGPMPDFKSVSEAPWYDGKDEIKRIVIEDGVTHVGSYAFYQYDQVEEITLPSTVTSYGWNVFRGIPSLETFHYYVEDTSAPSLDISVQYLVAKYSGNTYEPDVKVVHSTDGELDRGKDFEVTYTGTRNKGNGLITVTFLNDYASFGSWCVPFVVDSSYLKGENIKALETITLDEPSYIYDGRVKEPGAEVTSGQWKLRPGVDYTLEYAPGRVNVGSYPVKANGIGVYSDSKSIEADFEITVRDIASLASRASLSAAAYTYNRNPHTPRLSVAGLTEGKDYTVSYSGNVEAGTAYATAVGNAPNCTGEITLPFVIEEAPQTEPANTGSDDDGVKEAGAGTKGDAAENSGTKNTGTKDSDTGMKDNTSGKTRDGQTSGAGSNEKTTGSTVQASDSGGTTSGSAGNAAASTGNTSGSPRGQVYYVPGNSYSAGGVNETAVSDESESGTESAETEENADDPETDAGESEKEKQSGKTKKRTGKETFSKKKAEPKAESTVAGKKSYEKTDSSDISENTVDIADNAPGTEVPAAVKGVMAAGIAAAAAVILVWRKRRKKEE